MEESNRVTGLSLLLDDPTSSREGLEAGDAIGMVVEVQTENGRPVPWDALQPTLRIHLTTAGTVVFGWATNLPHCLSSPFPSLKPFPLPLSLDLMPS